MTARIHFHGIAAPSGHDEPHPDAAAAISRAGLPLSVSQDSSARPEYESAGGGVLWVVSGENADEMHFWATLDEQVFHDVGGAQVARLFAELVVEFRPILARSLSESLVGVVESRELTGPVEFVDWIQYFSPEVVARLGQEVIASAPFPQARWTEEGGCFLQFGCSPFEELVGRVAAADALGIALRPALARNPKTGARVVMPWS